MTNPNSTDLPALPLAYEYVYGWSGGHRSLSSNRWNGMTPDTSETVYTRDQMHAYLLADRTRNANAVVPEGWVPCTITYEDGDEPEEVAFGPQRMMDRLKKWLEAYFAKVYAERYPTSQNPDDAVRNALSEFVVTMDEKRAANEAMDQTVATAERSFAATNRLWANLEVARAALAAPPAASVVEAVREPLTEDAIMGCWEGCSDIAHAEVSIIGLARAIERAQGIVATQAAGVNHV